MNKQRPPLIRLVAGIALAAVFGAAHVCAQPTIFNDATNDIAAGISTGGGTLDIVKMEVVDTLTDVVFTMTVNGNVASPDWGHFMIGIANQKTPGSTTGNGWNRPINLNAGVTNGVTNGMTHWIGSWVNGPAGGAQLWSYNGAAWQEQTATPPGFVRAASAQSTVAYTISKASLGVTNGDTIIFDAYSSGGGGGDSAVDALSNPTNSISGWGGPYTSSATNITPGVGIGQTRSYTLANTALNTTTSVTFSVDMKAQIAIGTFNPTAGDIVSAFWGTDRANFIDLSDPDLDGIYTGTASVSAPNGTPVSYYYEILPSNPLLPLIPESVSRSFTMQATPLILNTVFFNNAPDYRNVTFTVDMSAQETAGNFNPPTQTVEVRGPFNNWLGTPMTAQGSGLYSATVLIGGANGSSVEYKYFTAGPGAAGYEAIAGNRTFTLEVNPGGAPNPPQILPTVFFSNQSAFRNVTFSVDMSVQQALGLFDPATGVVELRSGSFGPGDAKTLAREGSTLVYSTTFAIPGNEGDQFAYKFYTSGINYFIESDTANPGYEIINQANPFENRTITLGPANVAQPLPLAFFSNQLFGVLGTKTSPLPDSSLLPFTAAQGTPSVAQTVTVSGLGLTSNISATAATGFEVSRDGLSYGPTADILPTAGTVTAASLFVRIAGSAPAGALTNRISLTSSGSQSTSLRATGTVAAAANGYSNWLTNYPSLTGANTNGTADPDQDGFNNNLEFSFDGNPTVGTASLMTVRPVGTNAVFNWVQRTSGVGYEVQRNSSLTNAWTAASGLSISNSTNQSGLLIPADYIRREFILPASGKDFYRVQSTITNN